MNDLKDMFLKALEENELDCKDMEPDSGDDRYDSYHAVVNSLSLIHGLVEKIGVAMSNITQIPSDEFKKADLSNVHAELHQSLPFMIKAAKLMVPYQVKITENLNEQMQKLQASQFGLDKPTKNPLLM